MTSVIILCVTLSLFADAYSLSCNRFPKRSAPVFADSYIVKGVLLLPYAEIKEPFTAYYDRAAKKSRIDYYGGMVKTYQREDVGDYGVSFKIAYMPDENGKPIQTCFQVNGTKNASVSIQSILPDLTNFSYAKDDTCYGKKANKGLNCEQWKYETVYGDKVNRYTIFLKKENQEPLHYIMKGYNSLLGSHYDKYELYYTAYTPGPVPDSDFEVDSGIECRDFPGPGVERMVLNNPMAEFINNQQDHTESAFDKFKTEHDKSYKTNKDHEKRKNIFRQNFRYVNSMNRAGLSFGLKINHLADFTDQELHMIRGRLSSKGYNGGKPFPKESFSPVIPESLDWRLYGAVTQVKDQAVCGSCWSFGTTGTIEGSYFLKTNKLVRLSQQQLIDCSWRFENNGCDGGEDFRAYKYIMAAGGLATEEDYGSYLGVDGICHERNVTKTARIVGYVNVTSGDLKALQLALVNKGPISVSIDASQKSFSFYSHGVYYDPSCKNGSDQLDHSVLAVGYGVMGLEPYWIVKNSWSTYWGNDGYVLMSQKDNNCGVATSPTYVIMSD